MHCTARCCLFEGKCSRSKHLFASKELLKWTPTARNISGVLLAVVEMGQLEVVEELT